MTASETQIKKRGAPLKSPEDKKTAQEGYYRDYAREYCRKNLCMAIECPNCGKHVCSQKLKRHQTSKTCMLSSGQSKSEN